jgi:hypothetical protein
MDRLLDRVAALESSLQEVRDERRRLEHYARSARRRLRFWQGIAGALAITALLLAPVRRVTAQGNGGGSGLAQQVTALQTQVTNLSNQVNNLQNELSSEITNRQNGDTSTLASAKSYTDQQVAAAAADSQAAETYLQGQITPLTNVFLAPNPVNGQPIFSRVAGEILITGANLHIVNGLGATNGFPTDPGSVDPGQTHQNGFGNLIIGYNELRQDGSDDRSGSHNLVVGAFQNFTSFGGLLAGMANSVYAPYASVTGGASNTALNLFSSVSGGGANTASGQWSWIGGGGYGTASGYVAAVSGGRFNTAGGNGYSSVSGGDHANAGGFAASVSGGSLATARGDYASVSGGYGNTATGTYGSVSGGWLNAALGSAASVSGGFLNFANGERASVGGGRGIFATSDLSWGAGGVFLAPGPGAFHSP